MTTLSPLSEMIAESLASTRSTAEAIIARAEREGRALTADERVRLDGHLADLGSAAGQLEQARSVDARIAAPAASPAAPQIRVNREPLTYSQDSAHSHICDAVLAHFGRADGAALDRLQRHAHEVRVETRAGDTGDTAGGTFTPPLWMLNEYVGAFRPGRAVADLARRVGLPRGTDSINIPTVSTGTLTAIQATENTAATTRDMVTSSTTVDVCTVAGYYDVSLQQLEQSAFAGGWDALVYADLLADYDREVDRLALYGTGSSGQPWGASTVAGTSVTVAATTATAVFGGVADAINRVSTTRFESPTVLVMHPRRWYWLASRTDSSGRPVVASDPMQGQNLLAQMGVTRAQGVAGVMLGLPVVIDANVTTTAATNQDEVYVARSLDYVLMEGAPRLETFRTLGGSSETLTARIRLYNYLGFSSRTATATAKVTGAGLTTPTW